MAFSEVQIQSENFVEVTAEPDLEYFEFTADNEGVPVTYVSMSSFLGKMRIPRKYLQPTCSITGEDAGSGGSGNFVI